MSKKKSRRKRSVSTMKVLALQKGQRFRDSQGREYARFGPPDKPHMVVRVPD